MNQRRHPRLEASQSVWVTLFGEREIRLPAIIKNVSPRGVGLQLQGPVVIGTALKFELNDALLLGEVIYCREEASTFYIGVELEQALCGLGELANTVRAFTDYAVIDPALSPEKADPVKECRYQN